jgi:maltose alpha-D-glucosyltransferase/alpha-amylase
VHQQSGAALPGELAELAGRYFSLTRQLGARTAEVHALLAKPVDEPAFAPEPFNAQYQQSLYQWSRVNLARTFELLRKRAPGLPADTRRLLNQVLPAEKQLDRLLRRVVGQRIEALRIRIHGDLHLGQVLFTGSDFVIIDFEGEPARPINERRFKRGVLRDVMGMMRSFSYATEAVLRSGRVRQEDAARLQPWADAWTSWVRSTYLRAYLDALGPSPLLPQTDALKDLLLDFYELEKTVYEVEYELNNRPDWLNIPLSGLARLIAAHQEGK